MDWKKYQKLGDEYLAARRQQKEKQRKEKREKKNANLGNR